MTETELADSTETDRLDQNYDGSTDTLNQVRHDVELWLCAQQLEDLVSDAQLVVSELATNAIQASPGSTYRVTGDNRDGVVTLTVSNSSRGQIPEKPSWGPTHVLARDGRGLMIVKAICSHVFIEQTDGQTMVTAELPVTRQTR